MKRLPTDYVVLGKKFASSLSDYLSSDGSGSVIFYHGEPTTYEEFSAIMQPLAKTLYPTMTIVLDTSMIADKVNYTNYLIYIKATLPDARVIILSPGMDNAELISNTYACGYYDLVTTPIKSPAELYKTIDTVIDHPIQFSKIYKKIMWQMPVIKKPAKLSWGEKRRLRREEQQAKKLEKKRKKSEPEETVKVIDPYEQFLQTGTAEVARQTIETPVVDPFAVEEDEYDGFSF